MKDRLSDFLHDLQWADLSPDLAGQARLWLLDLLGVAAGGSRTRLSHIVREHAVLNFGAGPGAATARILFDGRSVSPVGAALAGGMTIDALDAHDGHKLTKGHVGCGVLPALLALAEGYSGALGDEASGGEFLTGLALGYEIGTRAGIALHRTAADYHTSGAWIAIATAALGARIMGLSAAQTREAIGIAEYHGPRSQMMRCIDHPTMVKDGSGWGAMAGVSAASLAAAGFTGAPALTMEADDVADLWSDLGQRWRITEQYYKPFPVCRWAQPSVQAVLGLREKHALRAEHVERIEITTFHEAIRLAVRRPQTTEQAQYSTAFPVASALVRGELGPQDVAETAFGDPEIARLANSIVFTESAPFNEAFPARRFSEVNLVLRDGRQFASGPVEALGDPEQPVDYGTVARKFHAYAGPVLGAERAASIEACVSALGRGTPLSRLLALVMDGA